MVGIASLMPQQGQMPGQAQQAPLPGMMPKPGASTPNAEIGQYAGMSLDQLVALFQQRPSGVLLRKIEDETKAQQMRAAAQSQGAMAQAQQQPGTVKDMVLGQAVQSLQPTQMAAHGGIMHGYAGGGAVAFQRGGAIQKFQYGAGPRGVQSDALAQAQAPAMQQLQSLQDQLGQAEQMLAAASKSGDPASLTMYAQKVQSLRSQIDRLASQNFGNRSADVIKGLASSAAPSDTSGLFPFGPPESPMMDVPKIQVAESAMSPAPAAVPRRQPAASTAPAPETTAKPAELTPEMAAALREQEARLRGRLTRPESLTKAEEGLAALAKSNIEAQQAEAKTYGEEIRAARDAALAKAQRDITSDPMSLLALAGSIDTRKGQGVGSLARGAAGLMGEREKQAEAARKEFALAQRDERAMQANIRQTQMLEAQRQVALEKGKLDEVNAINDQLSSLAIDREKFRLTRGDVAFQQAMKGREVAAEETKAQAAKISAGKPTELEQRIRLFQQNPEQYKTMYGIDPKETSVELRALKDEEQQLLKRLEATISPEARKPIETRLDDIIRMRRTLMGAPAAPAAKTMTMADIQATAASSGKTPEEVKKAAIAAGYTIQ